MSAKVVSAGVLGLVYGVVGTLAAVGAGAAVLTLLDQPTFLDQASTWRTIALSALALALWAIVGVGFGSVLTNQVAVIVVVLAFTQFVEPVLRFVLALTSWGADVAAYLPGAAGEAVSGGSFYSETGVGSLLEWWQGALVLLAYGVGLARDRARDDVPPRHHLSRVRPPAERRVHNHDLAGVPTTSP